MIKKILVGLGLAPSESDRKLRDLVNKSYKSVRVVGRGTIVIDPSEVAATPEFKEARARAADIVRSHTARPKK